MPDVIPFPKQSKRGGKRPGAGHPAKPLNEGAREALKSYKGKNPAFARILARFRTLGLANRQVIFELHARQGKNLTTVAEIMGLSIQAVWSHWEQIKADIAANAPSTESQFSAIREELSARLWATVEDTYNTAEIVDEATGKEMTVSMPPSPQMLAVRLKALDQIAKLYGVNLEREADTGEKLVPYASPAELKDMLNERVLALHAPMVNENTPHNTTTEGND